MLNGIADRLAYYMDLLSARQKLVASNIANANTPGYQTKDFDFHFEFMSQPEPGGAPPGAGLPAAKANRLALAPNVYEVQDLGNKNDGNNVSLDREVRLLAENGARFNVAANLWKAQLRAIKTAIQESKNA